MSKNRQREQGKESKRGCQHTKVSYVCTWPDGMAYHRCRTCAAIVETPLKVKP